MQCDEERSLRFPLCALRVFAVISTPRNEPVCFHAKQRFLPPFVLRERLSAWLFLPLWIGSVDKPAGNKCISPDRTRHTNCGKHSENLHGYWSGHDRCTCNSKAKRHQAHELTQIKSEESPNWFAGIQNTYHNSARHQGQWIPERPCIPCF